MVFDSYRSMPFLSEKILPDILVIGGIALLAAFFFTERVAGICTRIPDYALSHFSRCHEVRWIPIVAIVLIAVGIDILFRRYTRSKETA